MAFVLIWLVVGVVFAFIGAGMAKERNRDAAAWGLICALTGLIGVIALAIAGKADAQPNYNADMISRDSDYNRIPPRPIAEVKLKNFDEKKWLALLEVDDELSNAASALRPFGSQYVEDLAEKYLILNDKTYLSTLVEKIKARAVIETEKEQAEREEDLKNRQDESKKTYFDYLDRLNKNDGLDPDYHIKVVSVEKYTGNAKAFHNGLKVKFEDGTFALRGGFLIRKFANEAEMDEWGK